MKGENIMIKNKWRIMLTISIIMNLVLIFFTIDRSITIDYTNTENKYLNNRLNLLRSLAMDVRGLSSKYDVLEMVEQKYSAYLIKEDESGVLYINDVGLIFGDNELKRIIFLDE